MTCRLFCFAFPSNISRRVAAAVFDPMDCLLVLMGRVDSMSAVGAARPSKGCITGLRLFRYNVTSSSFALVSVSTISCILRKVGRGRGREKSGAVLEGELLHV